MAKLPENFVKPPPARSRLTTAKSTPAKLGRRSRKGDDKPDDRPDDRAGERGEGAVEASQSAALPDVQGVLVRLSDEEHAALSAACAALASVGHTVSIEDMIKQVIARWITATRAMQAPSLPAPAAAPRGQLQAGHALIRGQLRKLAEQPVRRWRELGQTLRRWSWSRILA